MRLFGKRSKQKDQKHNMGQKRKTYQKEEWRKIKIKTKIKN